MNDELINKANFLSKEFQNLDEYKEYKKIEKAISKNKRLYRRHSKTKTRANWSRRNNYKT